MKKNLSTIILVLVFFVGLSVLLYPSVSNFVNERTQTRAVASYDKSVAEMGETDYTAYFEAADEYNKALAEKPSAFYAPEEITGYDTILDVTGTGIMGYIAVEKIHVKLPIYHGTSAGVLQEAVGHLEGTSFPVGGGGTHAVLSAHRGLPSAKLFSDLDKVEVGDTFTVNILDRVLTYEVDDISIVLPNETEKLQIEPGKDYVTLMTCTPYGINTHRLLVRGHRIETAETKVIHVTAEAFLIEPIMTAPVIAAPFLLLLLIWMIFCPGKKSKRGDK